MVGGGVASATDSVLLASAAAGWVCVVAGDEAALEAAWGAGAGVVAVFDAAGAGAGFGEAAAGGVVAGAVLGAGVGLGARLAVVVAPSAGAGADAWAGARVAAGVGVEAALSVLARKGVVELGRRRAGLGIADRRPVLAAGGVDQGGEPVGQFRHRFRAAAVTPLIEVPDAIDHRGQDDHQADQHRGGEATLGHRGGEDQFGAPAQAAALLAEAAQDLGCVEAEELGVGTDEAAGIGGARQVLVPALLDGDQIGVADA